MTGIFYNLSGLNKELFLQINQITNTGFLPYILETISSVFFIANFAIIYILICIYFYFQTRKAQNPEEYFTPIYNELVRIGVCYALFGFVFAGLKFYTNMPRPFCSLEGAEFITIAKTEFERCLSSFPSAHTGLSILSTYALWQHLTKVTKILGLITVSAVAISRITLAMHYPADILYSAIITAIIIIMGNVIYKLAKPMITDPIKGIIFRLII